MYRRGEIVRGWFCFTCGKNHLSTSEAAACRLRAMKQPSTLTDENVRETLKLIDSQNASGSV